MKKNIFLTGAPSSGKTTGKMECFSQKFIEAVTKALNSPNIVIFLDEIPS